MDSPNGRLNASQKELLIEYFQTSSHRCSIPADANISVVTLKGHQGPHIVHNEAKLNKRIILRKKFWNNIYCIYSNLGEYKWI